MYIIINNRISDLNMDIKINLLGQRAIQCVTYTDEYYGDTITTCSAPNYKELKDYLENKTEQE